MERKLLTQALDLFDTPEKWNAFLELGEVAFGINNISNPHSEIQRLWWQKLLKKIEEKYRKLPDKNQQWDFYMSENQNLECRWFLSKYGRDSLMIRFDCDDIKIMIWGLNPNKYNEKIKEERFNCIFDIFEKNNSNRDIIANDNRRFFDKNFPNGAMLSWYAGHDTDKFADQIMEKIRNFIDDENITQLLEEIYSTCK